MTVTVAAVISVDGKLTRHDEQDVTAWASKEDQEHFLKLRNESDVILMGSGVYETVRDNLTHETGKLRVVLTSQLEKYQADTVPEKLEFYDEELSDLIPKLEARGYKKVLIAGGPRMISDAFKSNLVDNLYITVEPYLFGEGKPLTQGALGTRLELVSSRQLNSTGTVLLTYESKKSS